MDEIYTLMHKDHICGFLSIDADSGAIVRFRPNGSAEAPMLGHADTQRMKRWWETRAVPASRTAMQEVIHKAGYTGSKSYLAKNLALSLTDCYWICPIDLQLTWEDVNLYANAQKLAGKRLPYHNDSSYDPNASLGGQMEKYWNLEGDVPVLVKQAPREYGQQALNEVFAALLHERQQAPFPFVRYWKEISQDQITMCLCEAFTNISTEFIPALDVLDSESPKKDVSLYDAYIESCASHGIDIDFMSDFMDYQTMTDFLISNSDEHLMNFGILRNSNTLQFQGPAPIFDSGNSMFYSESRKTPYSRVELLQRSITSFHDKEEKMLRHVRNRALVRIDLLPTADEVRAFYARIHGEKTT